MVLGCTSVGTHASAQGAWVPLRPQWGGVGSANRAVGLAKQRGSELERALGARGGCSVLGCTSVGTHGTAQGAWVPLRPQWGDVGNANRAVGPSKHRGSELERALGARGGRMVLGVLAWVLTLAWRGRGCHYGRNGAAWGAQTARLDSQSKRGSELERALGARGGCSVLGGLTVV